MTKETEPPRRHDLPESLRETIGDDTLVMRSENLGVYEDAVETYAADGDRAVFLRSLMALGVSADAIRWHVANPGLRRMIVGFE